MAVKKNYIFDIDCVVADLWPHYVKKLKKLTNLKNRDIHVLDRYHPDVGIPPEIWANMFVHMIKNAKIKPIKATVEFINTLEQVTFLTARAQELWPDTKVWLSHYIKIEHTLVFEENKAAWLQKNSPPNCVFVDDRFKTVNEVATLDKEIEIILINMPYNQGRREAKGIRRVDSMAEVRR